MPDCPTVPRANVIYGRLSPRDGIEDGVDVDRQVKLARALAKINGDVVPDDCLLIDNEVSAMKRKPRPAFERLIGMLQRGEVRAIYVYHVDRLYRRPADLERLVELIEHTDVQVHTVSAGRLDLATASGRLVAGLLGQVARHESERLGERAAAKLQERRAAGLAPGGRPPYGYRKPDPANGEDRALGYVIDETEAAAVRFMVDRAVDGAGMKTIARELDAMGVPTREGLAWLHSTVRQVLLKPALAGLVAHDPGWRNRKGGPLREVASVGVWEPIIDRATFERVCATVADPARKRVRPARKFVLTGVATSPDGNPLLGATSGHRDGSRRLYRTRAGSSDSVSVDAEQLDKYVAELLFIRTDTVAITFTATPQPSADVEGLEADLIELSRLRGEGLISMAEWLAQRDPLSRRLDDARSSAPTGPPLFIDRILAKPGGLRREWGALSVDDQRAVARALIERLVVGPAFRARWTTIDERLDPEKDWGVVWRESQESG